MLTNCKYVYSYSIKEGDKKTVVEVCKANCDYKGKRLTGVHFRRKLINQRTGITLQDWKNDA